MASYALIAQVLIYLSLGVRADYENAQAFSALCEAYRATFQQISHSKIMEMAEPSQPTDTEALYIITLPEKNYTNETHGSYDAASWKAKKKELEEAESKDKEKLYRRPVESEARNIAHKQLKQIKTDEDNLAFAEITIKEQIKWNVQQAARYLIDARLGHNNSAESDDKPFGTRTNACTAAGGSEAGKSIVSDIACLCSATSAATNMCGQGTKSEIYTNAASTATNARSAWAELKSKCTELKPEPPYSGHRTAQAVTAVLSLIGNQVTTTNPANILGGGTSATCDGSSTANACVDYSAVAKTKGFHGIPWVAKFEEAAQHVAAAELAVHKLTAVRQKKTTLNRVAWSVYSGLNAATEAAQVSSKADRAPAPQATAAQDTEESCCKKAKNDCKDPCKWDDNAADNKKKCKLDPAKAAEQQTTQAGKDGDQATATECAKHGTDKTKCDADKSCK
ncbi:Trypanosomal VSG domain containing protein, putative [Trypanosoma equiperdum]|uniref:Trypanosomal VSG domain containing protein, putative n=1 Tax=Trypanosoma equiperdum TaxID=5694 RepID=A0A1G4HZL3_TRYEQ|nr:Trypanosomal VSG domain containing protein, putative [Trypanosoma equiperdum]